MEQVSGFRSWVSGFRGSKFGSRFSGSIPDPWPLIPALSFSLNPQPVTLNPEVTP